MQLTPRYDASVIEMDGPPSAIGEPLIRQRRRFADTLASLTDEQWTHPSRCDGWSSRDVVSHVTSATERWSKGAVSMAAR